MERFAALIKPTPVSRWLPLSQRPSVFCLGAVHQKTQSDSRVTDGNDRGVAGCASPPCGSVRQAHCPSALTPLRACHNERPVSPACCDLVTHRTALLAEAPW